MPSRSSSYLTAHLGPPTGVDTPPSCHAGGTSRAACPKVKCGPPQVLFFSRMLCASVEVCCSCHAPHTLWVCGIVTPRWTSPAYCGRSFVYLFRFDLSTREFRGVSLLGSGGVRPFAQLSRAGGISTSRTPSEEVVVGSLACACSWMTHLTFEPVIAHWFITSLKAKRSAS